MVMMLEEGVGESVDVCIIILVMRVAKENKNETVQFHGREL